MVDVDVKAVDNLLSRRVAVDCHLRLVLLLFCEELFCVIEKEDLEKDRIEYIPALLLIIRNTSHN